MYQRCQRMREFHEWMVCNIKIIRCPRKGQGHQFSRKRLLVIFKEIVSVEWYVPKCWVGQKVRSGFSISSYGKTGMNFLANPIDGKGNKKE